MWTIKPVINSFYTQEAKKIQTRDERWMCIANIPHEDIWHTKHIHSRIHFKVGPMNSRIMCLQTHTSIYKHTHLHTQSADKPMRTFWFGIWYQAISSRVRTDFVTFILFSAAFWLPHFDERFRAYYLPWPMIDFQLKSFAATQQARKTTHQTKRRLSQFARSARFVVVLRCTRFT